MMDKREAVARAICAEKCAFLGEPPCYAVAGEWPNPNCQEPGCHAEAQAALVALEPYAVQEAREQALREAVAACDNALTEMRELNPDRHDALPYIEDGCNACKDKIEALIEKP